MTSLFFSASAKPNLPVGAILVKGNGIHDPAIRTFGTSFSFKVDLICDIDNEENSQGNLEITMRFSIGRDRSEETKFTLDTITACWLDERTGGIKGVGEITIDGIIYQLRFHFIDDKNNDRVYFSIAKCLPMCGFPIIELRSDSFFGNLRIT
ncbi:MAG: hypothetical protein GPJ54_07100 [Candidatus Heimdallarchaeota archaeon]|nr:hypothetical protein [Candidatus Heimdallarchaeota archaeon]